MPFKEPYETVRVLDNGVWKVMEVPRGTTKRIKDALYSSEPKHKKG